MDLSIDFSFEKNFILNVINYVFAKHKTKIPKLLMEIIYEASGGRVHLFPSEIHHAVDVIMKAQEKVFKFLTKECIDFYYKRRISSEKAFLEFTTFHSRIALLDTFDNPEAATETYNTMMDSVANAKLIKDFTLNQEKIILESRKITGQGLDKYVLYLIDECDKMHTEATAIISDLPREAYLVSKFKKVKTKIEIGDKTSEKEFLDKEKQTEVKKAETKIENEGKASESEFMIQEKSEAKNDKVHADGTSKIQIRENPETQSSKSEKCTADSEKKSEFVDVELNEAKAESVSPEKRVAKGLSEVVATGDFQTVIVRRNENDLVQELLEAMEDIM